MSNQQTNFFFIKDNFKLIEKPGFAILRWSLCLNQISNDVGEIGVALDKAIVSVIALSDR